VLDKGRISSVQLLLIICMLDGATGIFFLASEVAKIAGPDSWISVSILPSLYGLLVAGVVIALAKRFPYKVFTEYLPDVVGKIPGKLLAAVYTLSFIFVASVILNEGTTFINAAFMPRTPLSVFDVMLAVVAIYGAYLGIECIARENELIFSLFMISILLTLALVTTDINLNNLKPVFENGILPAIKAAPMICPLRGYVFFILMLYPYLNQKQEAAKVALLFLLIYTVYPVWAMLTIVGLLGGQVTGHLVFPYLVLARYISVGNFLDRMEILIAVIWIAGVFMKLAVFYHSAAIAAANTLGLRSYRATLLPIAIITVIISRTLFPTILKLTTFLSQTYPIYALIGELAIPALILLIALIRKRM